MSFSLTERINLAAKALAGGVLDGDPSTQWYESVVPYSLTLPAQSVWTEYTTVAQNPAANLTAAIANVAGPLASIVQGPITVRLTPVPSVNNTYVALSSYGNFTSLRLGGWIAPVLVPQASGLPSFGYAARLYDGDPSAGGVEVLTTDGTTGTGANKSVGWTFNYSSGTLLTSDDFTVVDPYIVGFLYIGQVAGGAGTSGIDGRTLVYRPGGPTTSVAFNDFGALVAAANSIPGLVRVGFDTSFVPSPFTIPSGIYSFNNAIFEYTSKDVSAPLELRFQTSALLSGLVGVEGPINLINEGTTSPLSPSGFSVLYLRDGATLGSVAGSPGMLSVPASSFTIVSLGSGSTLSSFGAPSVGVADGSTVGLYLFEGGEVKTDVLSGSAAAAANVLTFSSSGRFDAIQPSFLGTVSHGYAANAYNLGYSASVVSDWSPVPSTGGEALDQLATRVSGVESTSGGNLLVYQPGGVSSGFVFSDWASLVAAAATIPGEVVVLFDPSITPSPFVIPVGSYSFPSSVTFVRSISGLGGPNLEVHLGNGVTLSGLVRIKGPLSLVSTSTTVSPIVWSSFVLLDLVDGAQLRSAIGAKSLISLAAGNFAQVTASFGGRVSSFGGGAPPVEIGVGSSFTISLLTGATSDNNVILGTDPGSSVAIQVFSPSARYGLSQSSFAGTVALSYPGDSGYVGYTPASGGANIWPTGVPSTVKEGLDSLAERGLSRVLQVSSTTGAFDLQTSFGNSLVVGGRLMYTSQSPSTALGATASDVAAALFQDYTVFNIASQPTVLTGLTGITGLALIITNTSSVNNLTISHENALSLATNRFSLSGSSDRILPPLSSARVYYGNDFRWHIIG